MISISNLNYKNILNNVNLNLEENKIYVVIGPNGSGKTTLLKSIAQLYKYDGDINIKGIDLKRLKHKEKAKIISYLPQHNLKTNIKVETLVRHGRYASLNFGENLKELDKKIVKENIEIVGINNILKRNLMDISGGERQLAYLAMVLTQSTPIILFDEPTTFLDISHQIHILEIIKKLKEEGRTIIIVLHDLIQAIEIADEIILIDNGKIVKKSTPYEIFDDIKKVFGVSISEYDINDKNALYKKYLLKG